MPASARLVMTRYRQRPMHSQGPSTFRERIIGLERDVARDMDAIFASAGVQRSADAAPASILTFPELSNPDRWSRFRVPRLHLPRIRVPHLHLPRVRVPRLHVPRGALALGLAVVVIGGGAVLLYRHAPRSISDVPGLAGAPGSSEPAIVERSPPPAVNEPTTPRAATAPDRQQSPTAKAKPCEKTGYEGAPCPPDRVFAADRALADAYVGAIKAHVSDTDLAAYSQRWAELRHKAAEDPDQTMAAYRAMAAELKTRAAPAETSPAEAPAAEAPPVEGPPVGAPT